MSWIFLVLGSVVLLSITVVIQRAVAIDSPHPRASTVVFNMIAACMAVILFFIDGGHRNLVFPNTWQPWFFLLFAVIAYGLFERYRFHTAKHLEAGVSSVVRNWSFIVVFLGSMIFYGEKFVTSQWIGVILVLLALIFISWPRKNSIKISKIGLMYGFFSSSMLGLASILDKAGATNFSPALYSIILWTTPALVVIFPKIKLANLKSEFIRSGKFTTIMALVNVIGYYLYLKALFLAPATQVIPIFETYMILTVILAVIFLKERKDLGLKFTSAIIALLGIWLLVK